MEEKPFWQKNKVLYTLLIALLVMGALIALSITSNVVVSAEQIIEFGKWTLTVVVVGHSFQRGLSYLAQGIAGHPQVVAPAPEPEPEEEE